MAETRMSNRGVRAQLLQTEEQWATRNAILSGHLADLIWEYSAHGATDGIEIGCQHGALTEQLQQRTQLPNWAGIDPTLTGETVTDSGCTMRHGRASNSASPTRRSMSRCSPTFSSTSRPRSVT